MTVNLHLYQNDTTTMPAGVPMQLWADGTLVGSAVTSDSGVASFDYERLGDETLRVRVDMDDPDLET